ncbi:LANO_0H01486g1_1 [Lachancea nothofagi CBS 11611]|uniref:Ribonuclease P protein subunit n=1 Tax=Lachancea nothofagi CBS 11611 TaxID=1266666 RepID=A0A1G4KL02_9SACH|nr:LANO_0H01486g1_1 [Lachancea nothofagi CBS 11611]
MNRGPSFITECILTKSAPNAGKLLDENRLQETLLLLPTDGGIASRLKNQNKKLRLLTESRSKTAPHRGYRQINKNAKKTLKEYINTSRQAASHARRIASEKNITTRTALYEYLEKHHPDVFKSIPRYDKILPMHEELWVNYVREILNIPPIVPSALKLNINGANALVKLSMADYNGCLLSVAKSRNANVCGMTGIVIWDSQKDFIIIRRGLLVDDVKCIPKKGTVFNFEVPVNDDEALQYTILGDRFKYRSSDRAGRKFKSRRCDDLLYYIER